MWIDQWNRVDKQIKTRPGLGMISLSSVVGELSVSRVTNISLCTLFSVFTARYAHTRP